MTKGWPGGLNVIHQLSARTESALKKQQRHPREGRGAQKKTPEQPSTSIGQPQLEWVQLYRDTVLVAQRSQ